ncbi:MAG: response regulator transcription factor [Kineosporiaceae bacterium]
MSTPPRTGPTAAEPSDDGRPVSVYLLDDHELLRRGLVAFLRNMGGFDVVGESGSAAEAGRRIPALRPDVALLDVKLPDGSGVEVCRQIRSRDPRIQVLMITSFDDEEARLASTLAGAAGFVLKDIDSEGLCRAVRRVAAGENLMSTDQRHQAIEAAAPRSGDPRWNSLTAQEQRIVRLLAEGLSNRQIAERLGLGEKTVKNYVSSILHKLGFARRTQAAVYALTTD